MTQRDVTGRDTEGRRVNETNVIDGVFAVGAGEKGGQLPFVGAIAFAQEGVTNASAIGALHLSGGAVRAATRSVDCFAADGNFAVGASKVAGANAILKGFVFFTGTEGVEALVDAVTTAAAVLAVQGTLGLFGRVKENAEPVARLHVPDQVGFFFGSKLARKTRVTLGAVAAHGGVALTLLIFYRKGVA